MALKVKDAVVLGVEPRGPVPITVLGAVVSTTTVRLAEAAEVFPAASVEISMDDGEFTKHRARTIVVGNVGFLQAGLPLLPDATLDDGQLDVVLINPKRFLHWLIVVVRVIGRGKKLDETVNRMTGRKVVIRASSEIPRQIDGDAIGAGTEIMCECLHGKLLVRVPR